MVRRLLVFTATISIAILSAVSAHAQTVLDPLHGYCAGTGQCIDNGSNSPTSTNPPSNFGFTVSPGPASGDLRIEILTPNNDPAAGSYSLTGSFSGTANPVAGQFTSGDLAAFLGISAAPNNPIGGFVDPSLAAVDPGATGFFVYNFDAGFAPLLGASNPNIFPIENLTTTVPVGSYIVAFLNEGTALSPDWIATALSGAILVTGSTSTTPVPEPGALMLLGTGLLPLAGMLRRGLRKA